MTINKHKFPPRHKPSRAGQELPDPDRELRDQLSKQRNEWSLRELGAKLGVSHVSIAKFLGGQPMRPSTRRRVRERLSALEVATGRSYLDGLIGEVSQVLGVRRGSQLRKRITSILASAYGEVGRDPPAWLHPEDHGS